MMERSVPGAARPEVSGLQTRNHADRTGYEGASVFQFFQRAVPGHRRRLVRFVRPQRGRVQRALTNFLNSLTLEGWLTMSVLSSSGRPRALALSFGSAAVL